MLVVASLFTGGAVAQIRTANQGAAGAVRTIGTYPQERGLGHTVTALPDGRIFVYGHHPHAQSLDAALLVPQLRGGRLSEVAPTMWDPTLHAWRQIPPPPQCQFSAVLHTATSLGSGRILIGGGLCDPPRPPGDDAPFKPFKALSIWNDTTQKWETAPELAEGRIYHTATLLDDGGVMFVGGERDRKGSDGTEPVLGSVELYRAGKVIPVADLQHPRAKHTSTRMPDGSIVVIGGMGTDGAALNSIEIWDSQTRTWREGPTLMYSRYQHTASLLSDGRILVVGGVLRDGSDISAVEIFDPSKSTLTVVAPLPHSFRRHSAIVLNNDDVLVAGVTFDRGHASSQIFLWEKGSGEWRPAGHLFPDRYRIQQSYLLARAPNTGDNVLVFDSSLVMRWSRQTNLPSLSSSVGPREDFSVVNLNDGRIMLAGGRRALPGAQVSKQGISDVEILDPKSGTITLTGHLKAPRASASAITLDNGSVLVASEGLTPGMFPESPSSNYAEVWNPLSGQWQVLKQVSFPDTQSAMLEKFAKLADGRVLFLFSELRYDGGRYRAVIWDPATDEAKHIPVDIKARGLAAIAIRPDGRVLIAGGYIGQGNPIWDPLVWDSHSGQVASVQFPPGWSAYLGRPAATLNLRNEKVLIVARTESSDGSAMVALWDEAAQGIRALPPLPVDQSGVSRRFAMIELSDGSYLVNNSILPPRASAWTAVPHPLQHDATMTLLHSKRLAALSSSAPHLAYFDELARTWETEDRYYLRRKKEPKPVLLELADGRVMISGNLDIEGWPSETTTQVWDPKNDNWSAPEKLSGVYTGQSEAALLPSGQVLYMGFDRAGALRCEVGHPSDSIWNDCNAPAIGGSPRFSLQTQNDGRIALVPTSGNAYIFNEPQKQWLPLPPNTMSALQRESAKPGSGWFHLPDGCFITGLPFRIFNPKTGTEMPFALPVTGIESQSARLIALTDGTVVVAGYPEGSNEPNSSFFHRKASCTGFAVEKEDGVFMPGAVWLPQETGPTATQSLWQRILLNVGPYRWIPISLAAAIVLYVALRRIGQRNIALDGGSMVPPSISSASGRFIATLLLGVVLFLIAPIIYRALAPLLVSSSSSHPCRFVGVWSSLRSGMQYQITLTKDGRYTMGPFRLDAGKPRIHTGTWAVLGDQIIWHHDDFNDAPPDVNPIQAESEGAFTLIEENGERTEFKLLEKGKFACEQ